MRVGSFLVVILTQHRAPHNTLLVGTLLTTLYVRARFSQHSTYGHDSHNTLLTGTFLRWALLCRFDTTVHVLVKFIVIKYHTNV